LILLINGELYNLERKFGGFDGSDEFKLLGLQWKQALE
jgi:hypothetical protein